LENSKNINFKLADNVLTGYNENNAVFYYGGSWYRYKYPSLDIPFEPAISIQLCD